MIEITQKYVRSLFDYRDGNLYWKKSGRGRKFGVPAGSVHRSGYRRVKINGKDYFAHRVIFLFHHGHLPEFLDHIDCNSSNNSIGNLRGVTHQENCTNQKKHKSYGGKPTTSKFRGVYWFKRDEKWAVQIQIGGKTKFLGLFDSEIEAAKAFDRAVIKRDGKFAKTNL